MKNNGQGVGGFSSRIINYTNSEGGYLKSFKTLKQLGWFKDGEKKEESEVFHHNRERKWRLENAKRRKKLKNRENLRLEKEKERIKNELEKYKKRKFELNPLKENSTTKKLRHRNTSSNRTRGRGGFLDTKKNRVELAMSIRTTTSPSKGIFDNDDVGRSNNNNNNNNDWRENSIISEPLPKINAPRYGMRSYKTVSYGVNPHKKKIRRRRKKKPWRMKKEKYHDDVKKNVEKTPDWKKKMATGFSREIDSLERSIEKMDRVLLDKQKNLKIFKYNEKLLKKKIKIVSEENDEDEN